MCLFYLPEYNIPFTLGQAIPDPPTWSSWGEPLGFPHLILLGAAGAAQRLVVHLPQRYSVSIK